MLLKTAHWIFVFVLLEDAIKGSPELDAIQQDKESLAHAKDKLLGSRNEDVSETDCKEEVEHAHKSDKQKERKLSLQIPKYACIEINL